MHHQRAFFDLLDIMESEKLVEPKRFFDLMRGTFKIANLLYLDAEILPSGLRIHRLHHTFGARMATVYVENGFHRIDPTLRMAIDGARPVDWALARKRHPESEPLFQAAAEFGLPLDGISLPLAAPRQRAALLAINAGLPASKWPPYRRCHLRDFQLLASLFHASLLESDQKPGPAGPRNAMLTDRETEVLGWTAAGKSYWEIATILGISERTVRFFMTNARRKLNVVSNTQAVAQAVHRALIPVI